MEKYLAAYHRVRSYELDSFGHVNNAVFLNYLEFARIEYLLQRGLSFDSFREWGAFPYVVNAEIQYKTPAKVHDRLEIRGIVSNWKKSSFVLSYSIYNQDSEVLVATATMTFAFVDGKGKLIPIPLPFKEKMDF